MMMKTAIYLILISILVSSCRSKEQPIELVGWGDSMMKGAGGERSILEVISRELGGMEYTNYGVGGLKSNSIAILQGGLPLKLKFDRNNIGLWGKATTTYFNILPFNSRTRKYRKGRLNNTKGRLIRNGNKENPKITESFTFQKRFSFEPLEIKDTVIFEFDEAIQKQDIRSITIIWAGRNDSKKGNNIYKTRDNIKAIVDNLKKNPNHKEKYIILSVCNGAADKEFMGSRAYEEIKTLNNLLKNTFRDHFVDVRTYMVNKAIYEMGMEPTNQDLNDIKKDCIPRSFLNDNVHFNTLGYEASGKYLTEVIRKKGWID